MTQQLHMGLAAKHNMARATLTCVLFCLTTAATAVSPNWWVDITNDRVDAIKTELAQGESPNEVNSKGQPALMQAIRDSAWKVFDLLASHRGVDVNAENRMHETPLMYLAVVGDVKRAQVLIKRGAHVNHLGWSPLHYAASKGHADMVKLLIANKAIVNAPSPDGTTPLMMAAFAGSEECVRLLLGAGADVTTRNLKQQNAVDWARMRNQTSLAKRLDELNTKVLAARAAMHARNKAAGRSDEESNATVPGVAPDTGTDASTSAPGGSSGNEVKAVDIRPPAVPPALDTDKAAKPSSAEGNSTSRYFDLKRFDKGSDY